MIAATVLAGCGSNADGDGASAAASGDIAYGTLLSSQPSTGDAVLPSAAGNTRVTYMSEGPQGDPAVVSGSVSVPGGPAPDGGWPVISWAHGTTGVADACAPSSGSVPGSDGEYLRYVDDTLDRYVQAGYAVVQTDYVGLGTPGVHPYINGDSEANAVTDIVTAARELDSSIGTTWYVAGHSQGGHAAVFTAAEAPSRAPDLNLEGAVAIAPGNRLGDTLQYFAAGGPDVRAALGYLPLILLGAQAADPGLKAYDYVSDPVDPLLDAATNGCTDATFAAAQHVPVDKIIPDDADLTPMADYLAKQNLGGLTLQVPTLILQGTADSSVTEPSTTALVDTLCTAGNPVSYKTYDGLEHTPTVPASFDDALAFIRTLGDGGAPGGVCGA
uniref:lipase family protein n=1 Tax=Tomitella fengzijianii TaxID=2597660 RepID=UPI001E343CBF|nr:lipase family protein [Tomitella fengzijianii]